MAYQTLPHKATLSPTKFTAHATDDAIKQLRQLVELSPLGPRTYENTTTDQYLGIKYEWMAQAKERWAGGYDW